jgi:hypothetical protein
MNGKTLDDRSKHFKTIEEKISIGQGIQGQRSIPFVYILSKKLPSYGKYKGKV